MEISYLMLALIVALFPVVICQQSFNVTRSEFECAQNISMSSQNFSLYCPTEALGMELDVSILIMKNRNWIATLSFYVHMVHACMLNHYI